MDIVLIPLPDEGYNYVHLTSIAGHAVQRQPLSTPSTGVLGRIIANRFCSPLWYDEHPPLAKSWARSLEASSPNDDLADKPFKQIHTCLVYVVPLRSSYVSNAESIELSLGSCYKRPEFSQCG